jgi:hypothetical protein
MTENSIGNGEPPITRLDYIIKKLRGLRLCQHINDPKNGIGDVTLFCSTLEINGQEVQEGTEGTRDDQQ